MKSPRPIVVIICLATLYGFGLASGWLLFARRMAVVPAAASVAPTPAPVTTEEKWAKTTLAEYRERLALTPAQIETVKPLLVATSAELRDARAEATIRILGVVKRLNEKISHELTVEQRRKLVELVKEKQAARARRNEP